MNNVALLFLGIERLLRIIDREADYDNTSFIYYVEINIIDDDTGFEHLPIPR